MFTDVGDVPTPDEPTPAAGGGPPARRRRAEGAVPLLEAAFRLFGWKDDAAAARALNTSADSVRAWRSGREQMAFADYLTLTSMIAIAAAEAMKGDLRRVADVAAAAEVLGLRSG